MRHRKRTKGRLGRPKAEAAACIKSVASSLIFYERITTTLAKAKEARRLAEKLITLGKQGGVSNTRKAAALLGNDRNLTRKLFNEIAPRFKNRTGGYTRIIRKGRRLGDNASLVLFELTEREEKKKTTKQKEAKKEEPKAVKSQDIKQTEKEAKKSVVLTDKKEAAKKELKQLEKKPKQKFFRRIFKKERDSL